MSAPMTDNDVERSIHAMETPSNRVKAVLVELYRAYRSEDKGVVEAYRATLKDYVWSMERIESEGGDE